MGSQGKAIEELNESAKLTAASVSVGGALYSRIDALVTTLENIASGKGSKGSKNMSLKESMAMAIMAPTLKPIGVGLGSIVEALNKLGPDGEKKAKAMEGIAGALAKLGEVGKAIFAFAGYMALSIPLLIITAVASPLILIALTVTIGAVMLAAKLLDEDKIKALQGLKKVGLALLVFAGSMAIISFIITPAVKGAVGMAMLLLILGITMKVLDVLGVLDGKRLQEFGKGMLLLGLGFLTLAVSFALVQLIMPMAMKGAIWALGIILVMGLMFWMLDKMGIDKSMREGIMAIALAGIAIVGLGLAFLLFSYMIPDMSTVWAAIKMLGIVGVTFAVIGAMEKPIKSGAKALLWASLSMIVVALAMLLLNALIPPGDMSIEMFKPLLVIAGVGAAFAVIGLAGPLIQSGGTAMIVAAIGIILVAVALKIIQKPLEKGGWGLIGQVGGLLAMIGIEFGLFGLAAPFILAGAAAMLVAGVAMIAIAGGTAAMAAVMDKSAKLLAEHPSGDGTNLKVLMGTIGDSFNMWPWEAAGIVLGAAAMITAGVALITVGVGIKKFQKLSETADLPLLAENISYMIGSLAVPFQKIGAGGTITVKDPISGKNVDIKFSGGGGGFFGMGGSNPVSMGISSVHGMGGALTGIAKGVQSMANLKFPTGYDKEGNATGYETLGGDIWKSVIENTIFMVGALAVPFAKIGSGLEITADDGTKIKLPGGGKKGLFASIFGGGESNPVADGIASVQGMGTALTGIAMGVQAMAMLKFPTGFDPKTGEASGYEVFNAAHAETVTTNTEMLIGALTKTFAKIGKSPDAEGGSWWGGKSTIQKGVDLVASFGLPLTNLAKGVQDMANLRFANKWDADGKAIGWVTMSGMDSLLPKIESNTRKLIQAMTNVFTTIGGGKSKTSSWWQGETKFEKGIAIIEMIAEPFAKLGKAAKHAGSVVESVKNADEMRGKVQAMVEAISNAGNGESESQLQQRINYLYAVSHAYDIFSYAIPKIVTGVNAFVAEKGKAFMSVFGGETSPESLVPKLMLLKGLSDAYGKMSWAIPKLLAGIATLVPEQMNSFVKVIGGDVQDGVLATAKKAMFVEIGTTFGIMGNSIPRITAAINGLNNDNATTMKDMFIGPVGIFNPSRGYEAQTELWQAIGGNMTANATSFPAVATAINSMDLTKLKESRQMFEALAVLAGGDSPDDILAAMGESLETALQNLADMLKEFKGAVTEGNAENTSILERAAGAVGGAIGSFASGVTGGGGGDSAEVVSAIRGLRSALVKTGIKVSNMPDEL